MKKWLIVLVGLIGVSAIVLCAKGKKATAPEFTIDNCTAGDPNGLWLDVEMAWSNLCITAESGGDLYLSFKGDKLEITGDADMNEAAKAFFYEYLKPMVDEYIKERWRLRNDGNLGKRTGRS